MHFTNQEIEDVILLINKRMNGYTSGLIAAADYTNGIILSLHNIPLPTKSKIMTIRKLLKEKDSLSHPLFSSPPIFIEKKLLAEMFSNMKKNYENKIRILEKEIKVLKKGKHHDPEA